MFVFHPLFYHAPPPNAPLQLTFAFFAIMSATEATVAAPTEEVKVVETAPAEPAPTTEAPAAEQPAPATEEVAATAVRFFTLLFDDMLHFF